MNDYINKDKINIGKIHSLESLSIVDGPGSRYVVFMQGCNLRCKFCHNPDTWIKEEGKDISVDELFKKICNCKAYFTPLKGGVTFTGGEPLLQIDFLIEICTKLKEEGINIAIDTAGNFKITEKIKKLLSLVDLVMLDIKHINNSKHKKLTGAYNDQILNFGRYLSENNIPMWIRIVYMPGITNDNEDNMRDLKSYIKSLNNVKKIDILPYHTMGVYKWNELGIKYMLDYVPIPDKKDIARITNYLNK